MLNRTLFKTTGLALLVAAALASGHLEHRQSRIFTIGMAYAEDPDGSAEDDMSFYTSTIRARRAAEKYATEPVSVDEKPELSPTSETPFNNGDSLSNSPSPSSQVTDHPADTLLSGKSPVLMIVTFSPRSMPEIKIAEEILMQFESMELCEKIKTTETQLYLDGLNKDDKETVGKLKCITKFQYLGEIEEEAQQERQKYEETQDRLLEQRIRRDYQSRR